MHYIPGYAIDELGIDTENLEHRILVCLAKYCSQVNRDINYVDLCRSIIEAGQTENVLQGIKSGISTYDLGSVPHKDVVCDVINSIVRTNAFLEKDFVAFKFAARPYEQGIYAEIFVCGKNFEGVHIRAARVSRGGIRWSDRSDYRVEAVELVRTQTLKNVIVVPSGSKGSFITKYKEDVVECYKDFLRGMLDLTDNIIDGKPTFAPKVLIKDDMDTYLVVAADKGTSTFSVYANQVCAEYGFWLGDAFASGGSNGYDHKKLGITAKGAWISVLHHLQTIGKPEFISTIGVGDMSGDVFGNGMLLQKNISLVAAFDHRHIFLDPVPDVEASYNERLRLFNMRGSKWSDYDLKLISKDGGVFERDAQSINITESLAHIGIAPGTYTGKDLIKAILCAKADLLWFGGIGTYVKSSTESNQDIIDKENDYVRVDAKDIRAKVISEGANLALSQAARIEFAENGGKINNDATDNSAGVGCSDHEVNIKIALNIALQNQKIDSKERDRLILLAQPEAEDSILLDNTLQNYSLSMAEMSEYSTRRTWRTGLQMLIDGNLIKNEHMYLVETLEERFVRPNLAVLHAYAKMYFYNLFSKSLPIKQEDRNAILLSYFPRVLHENFTQEILKHSLGDTIVASMLTNMIVNEVTGAASLHLCNQVGFGNFVSEFLRIRNKNNIEHLRHSIINSNKELKIKVQDLIEIARMYMQEIV